MSLEQAIAANTAAVKELTAALIASGALQTAQASAALHSAPGVQVVVAAQRELAARDNVNATEVQTRAAEGASSKKQTSGTAADAPAADASAAVQTTSESKPSGATSAQTPEKSSDAQQNVALKPWATHTAEIYAELKDAAPTAENVKRLIVFGINQKIPGEGRAIAEAVLARFGANAVSEKPGKKGLTEDQYADVLAYGLRVLAGTLDPRETEVAE